MQCFVLGARGEGRRQLARALDNCSGLNLVVIAGSLAEFEGALSHTFPDVLFVDAGFEALGEALSLAEARNSNTLTVAWSPHAANAMLAFDLEAIDFLLVPVDGARLSECARRLVEERQRRTSLRRMSQMQASLENMRRQLPDRTSSSGYCDFWLPSLDGSVRVGQSEIFWLKAARGYAYFNLRDRRLLHRISMLELEEKLDPSRFLRIHRSAIVNVDHVELSRLGRQGADVLLLSNGDDARVGRKYRRRVLDFLQTGRLVANDGSSREAAPGRVPAVEHSF